MKELEQILKDLKEGKISVDHAESAILRLSPDSCQHGWHYDRSVKDNEIYKCCKCGKEKIYKNER